MFIKTDDTFEDNTLTLNEQQGRIDSIALWEAFRYISGGCYI